MSQELVMSPGLNGDESLAFQAAVKACPVCSSALIRLETPMNPVVHACSSGDGVWISEPDLSCLLQKPKAYTADLGYTARFSASLAHPCPQCRESLQFGDLGSARIFSCLKCNGYWLPADTLSSLYDRYGSQPYALQTRSLYSRAARQVDPEVRPTEFFLSHCPPVDGKSFWILVMLYVLLIPLLVYAFSARSLATREGRGSVYGALGISMMLSGWRLKKQEQLIATMSLKKIRDISPGLIELSGEVYMAETFIRAPFTAAPCLFYSWKLERQGVSEYETVAEANRFL